MSAHDSENSNSISPGGVIYPDPLAIRFSSPISAYLPYVVNGPE